MSTLVDFTTRADIVATDKLGGLRGEAAGAESLWTWAVLRAATLALFAGFNERTWAAAALEITPGALIKKHLEVITVTLGTGAATLTVTDGDAATRGPNDRLDLLIKLPGTVGIIITILNTAGDTLATVSDDGTGDDCLLELYHDGTKWAALRKTYPLYLTSA